MGITDACKQVLGMEDLTKAGPVQMFIAQERVTGFKMVTIVNDQLARLSQILRGKALMTKEVFAVGSALVAGEIPGAWEDVVEGSLLPITYLRRLIDRTVSLQGYVEKARKDVLFDSEMDMSDLFRPATFLNALRQETAQKLECAIDDVILECTWDRVSP